MADKTVYVQPVGDDRDTHYHTLADAVAAEAADLTASGMLYIIIRGDWSGGADTDVPVDVDGYTTDATHYIKISTDAANRASTTWSTGKYILQSTGYLIYFRENYTWIDGLQMQLDASGAANFFLNVSRSTGWIRISNSVLRSNGSANKIRVTGVASGAINDLTMWNCIFYNWGSNSDTMVGSDDSNTVMTMYNCTVISNASATIAVREDSGTLICKNCYAGGSGSYDYYGSIALTTCASEDTTGDLDSIAINTTNFTNVSAGTEDWALPAGSGLIDEGTGDPGSGLFSDDIDGNARGTSWCIGASEYLATGGASGPLPVIMQLYAMLGE